VSLIHTLDFESQQSGTFHFSHISSINLVYLHKLLVGSWDVSISKWWGRASNGGVGWGLPNMRALLPFTGRCGRCINYPYPIMTTLYGQSVA